MTPHPESSASGRIVIFIGSHGYGAGAERVLEYFLEGAVTRRDDIALLAAPTARVSTVARDLGYAWVPWQTTQNSLAQNGTALLRLLAAEGRRPPGSHVHAWHTRGLEWALALARHWKLPASGTLHDDPEHQQFGRVRKQIIRWAAHHLDGVAAVSEAVVQRCHALGWRVPVATLKNGLPEAPPRNPPLAPRRVGFLGTNVVWKGISTLPAVVEICRDLGLEWHLFGDQTAETRPALQRLEAMPGVTYHGHVDLATALAHTDILLHLALELDPYPTVLLEAARAGVATVATHTGGSPEIVQHGSTGLLVPPADAVATAAALRRLVTAPAEWRAMGLAARVRFEQAFRVEHMVADYFSFWNGLRSVSRSPA